MDKFNYIDKTNGQLVVDTTGQSSSGSSGTYTSWEVNLPGAVAIPGSGGSSGSSGTTGSSGSSGSSPSAGSSGSSGW